MNKMYEYLKNHAYISYNKKSTYEFELSEERAQCIANKYDSLTDELQQENKQLKIQISAREEVCNRLESNWNKLKEWLNSFHKLSEFEQWEIVNKMQELEQGSDE